VDTTPSPAGDPQPDLLIVGSGIMGSLVASLVRAQAPHARILMVEGGLPIGATPGTHLHDVAEEEIWSEYNSAVSTGIQGFYAGAVPEPTRAADPAGLEPRVHLLSTLGEDADAMPMAAAAWNVGGMGAHWTAAVPWPEGEERFDFGDPARFARDLAVAQEALHATSPSIGPTLPGRIVLEQLAAHYGARTPTPREPQPMPMAFAPGGTGRHRVGPAVIFPPIGGAADDAFDLLTGHLAVELLHDDGRVAGARLRRTADDADVIVHAAVTVVCADTFRTPQLLHASGIRPAALGRYVNEHAFLTGRVLLDLDRFGLALEDLPTALPGEFCVDSLWLPHNGAAQPFHGQIMNSTYVDEDGSPLGYGVGISLYVPIESRPENRVRFVDGESDLTGLPRFEIDFSYSDADRAAISRARAEMAELFALFGDFDPDTESALLPPGSSLHQTGTVRMGPVDDGTSVCDPDGRVWGFDNLFVAGNGVVPTAVVANATLTGAVTAVRAANAAVRQLSVIPA
jgi:choline dehydrogenase-like flavoprotein